MNIYANYKVEYFLMLKRVDFAQKKKKNLYTVFIIHIFAILSTIKYKVK